MFLEYTVKKQNVFPNKIFSHIFREGEGAKKFTEGNRFNELFMGNLIKYGFQVYGGC